MIAMPYRYLGGPQQPDLHGYLEPGDVLDLAEQPEVGEWEQVSAKATGPSDTPQPVQPEEEPSAAAEPLAQKPPPNPPGSAATPAEKG